MQSMKSFLLKYGGPDEWYNSFDNIWITSDLHFGHDKIKDFEPIRDILRQSAGFTGTPDEFIIKTWNEQVGKNDLVINLGDLHWKSYQHFDGKLNGTQLLILGNHDRNPHYYIFDNLYVVNGVFNLDGHPTKYITVSEDPLLSGFFYNNVLYSHYPVYNIEHEYNYQRKGSRIVDRMKALLDLTKDYDIVYNIHGHLHSACPEGTDRSLNVCYDFNKYKLIDWDVGNAMVRTSKGRRHETTSGVPMG